MGRFDHISGAGDQSGIPAPENFPVSIAILLVFLITLMAIGCVALIFPRPW